MSRLLYEGFFFLPSGKFNKAFKPWPIKWACKYDFSLRNVNEE